MTQRSEVEQQNLEDILNQAVDLTDNKVNYATNIRFYVTNNEVTLDFYYVSSDPNNPSQPMGQRLNRIVIPLGLAKNIGQLLVNGMNEWEANFGVNLPFSIDEVSSDMTGGEGVSR